MSNNFLDIFSDLSRLNEEAKMLFSKPRIKKLYRKKHVLSFGEYIRKHRRNQRIIQVRFSKDLAISRSQLSRIERDKAVLQPEKLVLISELLNRPLSMITKLYYRGS